MHGKLVSIDTLQGDKTEIKVDLFGNTVAIFNSIVFNSYHMMFT